MLGVVELMGQQLSFLGRDATLHNVFFAALPDAAMAVRAIAFGHRSISGT